MGNNATGDVTSYRVSGVLLEIPNSILNDRMRKTFSNGNYEGREAQLLSKAIKAGEVVLELGAGVGFISTIAGRNPLTKAIYAVEANPTLIPIIQHTHRINNIKSSVFHEVMGVRDGRTTFRLAHTFTASSVSGVWGGQEIEVPMASFQKRLDQIRPTMLIVDIEGGELTLFDRVHFPSVRTILLEIHPNVIGPSGVKRVFDTLSTAGFTYDAETSLSNVVTFVRVYHTLADRLRVRAGSTMRKLKSARWLPYKR